MMGTGNLLSKGVEEKTGLPRFDTDEINFVEVKDADQNLFDPRRGSTFVSGNGNIRSISLEEPAIIVTGGGIVLRKENVDL